MKQPLYALALVFSMCAQAQPGQLLQAPSIKPPAVNKNCPSRAQVAQMNAETAATEREVHADIAELAKIQFTTPPSQEVCRALHEQSMKVGTKLLALAIHDVMPDFIKNIGPQAACSLPGHQEVGAEKREALRLAWSEQHDRLAAACAGASQRKGPSLS